MQKVLFPMETARCTQDENSAYSHAASLARDWGGKSGATDDKVFGPCDIVCRRVREDSSHEMYFESIAAVECADGYKGIVHFTFMHDNKINSNVKVGQIIRQGEYFMDEGGFGKGMADKFDRHVHIEAGKGPSPAKQVRNSKGTYVTSPQSRLCDIFFIAADTKVMNLGSGNWKHTTDKLLDTSQNGGTDQSEVGVGSLVQFNGGGVYESATSFKVATNKGSSQCKVTAIATGTAHPYHLISQDNGGVWGWVDAASIAGVVVEEPQRPDLVEYSGIIASPGDAARIEALLGELEIPYNKKEVE